MKSWEDRISPSKLKIYLDTKDKVPTTIQDCNRIITLIKNRVISKIIFDYGITKINHIVDLLEKEEEYELLAVLRDKLEVHNKVTKRKFKLRNE